MDIFKEFTIRGGPPPAERPARAQVRPPARSLASVSRSTSEAALARNRDGSWTSPSIKQAFQPLQEQLDHHYLNEIEGLEEPDEREPRPLDLDRLRPVAAAAFRRGRVRDVHVRLRLRRRGGVSMDDVQNHARSRRRRSTRSASASLRYPIVVLDRQHDGSRRLRNLTMSVNLPHHFKGTHMSRFIEVLNEHRGEVTMRTLPAILAANSSSDSRPRARTSRWRSRTFSSGPRRSAVLGR